LPPHINIEDLNYHIEYWGESQKETEHQENQDVGGWMILKWVSSSQTTGGFSSRAQLYAVR
jgi:hypothetical protein